MPNYRRSQFDVPAADECIECHGRGYTQDTAQRSQTIDRKYVTTELGYGCTTCLGLGRMHTMLRYA